MCACAGRDEMQVHAWDEGEERDGLAVVFLCLFMKSVIGAGNNVLVGVVLEAGAGDNTAGVSNCSWFLGLMTLGTGGELGCVFGVQMPSCCQAGRLTLLYNTTSGWGTLSMFWQGELYGSTFQPLC